MEVQFNGLELDVQVNILGLEVTLAVDLQGGHALDQHPVEGDGEGAGAAREPPADRVLAGHQQSVDFDADPGLQRRQVQLDVLEAKLGQAVHLDLLEVHRGDGERALHVGNVDGVGDGGAGDADRVVALVVLHQQTQLRRHVLLSTRGCIASRPDAT